MIDPMLSEYWDENVTPLLGAMIMQEPVWLGPVHSLTEVFGS